MSTKSHVRPGRHTVTAGVNVKKPDEYVDWAKNALGAEVLMRFVAPNGVAMHTEIRIGDTILGVDAAIRDPETSNALFHLYVPDVDAAYKRALEGGAKSKMEPMDMFFGERLAVVTDPNGNSWGLAMFQEELSMDEIGKRAVEFMARQQRN